MKIRPLHDRVAVRRSNPETVSKGGIIIPDVARDKQTTEGLVVAVGDGMLLTDGTVVPLALKVGDRVLINKYGGHAVTVEGDEIVFLREDEVHAVLED